MARNFSLINGWLSFVVPSLLVISSAGNLIQYSEIRRIMSGPGATAQKAPSGAAYGPSIGDLLPPLPIQDVNGKTEVLSFSNSSKPMVLYVFSPVCAWCNKNRPAIRRLASQVSDKFIFVGVVVNAVNPWKYQDELSLGFRVYSNRSRAGQLTFGFNSTPQTLVVSSKGKLLKRWKGAFVGPQKADIERYFDCHIDPIL